MLFLKENRLQNDSLLPWFDPLIVATGYNWSQLATNGPLFLIIPVHTRPTLRRSSFLGRAGLVLPRLQAPSRRGRSRGIRRLQGRRSKPVSTPW